MSPNLPPPICHIIPWPDLMKLLKRVWKAAAEFHRACVCLCVASPLEAGPLVALATPSPRRAPAVHTAGATWWVTRLCRAASRSRPETCRLRFRLPRSHQCCSWSLQGKRGKDELRPYVTSFEGATRPKSSKCLFSVFLLFVEKPWSN